MIDALFGSRVTKEIPLETRDANLLKVSGAGVFKTLNLAVFLTEEGRELGLGIFEDKDCQ